MIKRTLPDVEAHLAAGRYAEAASAARAAEDFATAREIYEKIWEFRAAAECALAAGDRAGALKHFLDARAHDEATRVASELCASGPDGARAAADAYEARRLHAEAAAIHERLGDAARAAPLYQRAGQIVDAARMLEALGRDREAGRLYERLLDDDPSSNQAPAARLALGRLLARLGQHGQAAKWLQEAARDLPVRADALRALVGSLAALGLRDASRDALARARDLEPSLPADVEAFVASAARRTGGEGPTTPREPIVGGRYRLLRLLGAGGSGRVHLARDEVSGRDVAVKLFFAAHARGHEAYERFVREARISGRGRHPNIVDVLEFREDLGFLVMEYLGGGTLADRLKPRVAPAIARRFSVDVLAGLAHAHARGVVHRDIKPANIFFDARGSAKIGDFGVAHLLDLGQTQTGGLIGTLAYMSPEQITAAPITVAADLYAFGVTLFLALTGRLPFLGPDFVAQHLGEPAPRPSSLLPDLGDAWDPIVLRLLEKDPSARPCDAEEVRAAIQSIDVGESRSILILPRSSTSGPLPVATPSASSISADPAAPSTSPAASSRYHGESPLGETSCSTLSRAVDASLARTVVLERFAEGHPDVATERRLYLIAAAMGPHLQRVLAWDRPSRTVVLEAPLGETLAARLASGPLVPQTVARLLIELLRGLAPLHALGGVHGALTADRVLIDEISGGTIVACGLGPAPADATAEGDARAALDLAATALRGGPATASELPSLARAHVLLPDSEMTPPSSPSDLLGYAEALAHALARAARARMHIASLVEQAWHLDATLRDATLKTIRGRALAHGIPLDRVDEIVR